MKTLALALFTLFAAIGLSACGDIEDPSPAPVNPLEVPVAESSEGIKNDPCPPVPVTETTVLACPTLICEGEPWTPIVDCERSCMQHRTQPPGQTICLPTWRTCDGWVCDECPTSC